MRKSKKQYKPISKREAITNRLGYTMIVDPIEPSAPEPKSKRRVNPITAARHLSALDTLLRRGIIDESRHAAEVAVLKARLR